MADEPPSATRHESSSSFWREALLLRDASERAELYPRARAEPLLAALETLPPSIAGDRLAELPEELRTAIETASAPGTRERWTRHLPQRAGTVGALMRPPIGVMPVESRAGDVVEWVRRHASAELTYLYPVDERGRVVGVIVLRDLFLASSERRLGELMVRPPFFLTPEMSLLDAMHAVVGRHFPVYPVCEADGTLLGLVRGHVLFENQVITITAQAGKLVGVPATARAETSFGRSLRLRLPWLLLNLVMSLGSALVMLLYKPALARFIILAVFLTVVTTQGRNSGAQTMALVLRGITAGTWHAGRAWRVLRKEVLLGVCGGGIVGAIAGVAIWFEEQWVGNPAAVWFGVTVFTGMVLGCATSCAAGVAMPLVLRRLGFDPALAAGILLTNLCTVACQLLFLSLAVWWLM